MSLRISAVATGCRVRGHRAEQRDGKNVAEARRSTTGLAAGFAVGTSTVVVLQAHQSHVLAICGFFSRMLLTSMKEPSRPELGRCRSLWRLRCAHVEVMMVAAWFVTLALRQAAARLGLLRCAWHPALFVFSSSLFFHPGSDCRAKVRLTVAEVTTKRGEDPPFSRVSPPPPPDPAPQPSAGHPALPFLIAAGTVVFRRVSPVRRCGASIWDRPGHTRRYCARPCRHDGQQEV